jgi:putative SOS response-associated peptidase YedK
MVFCEWRKIEGEKKKIPMRFVLKSREPFAFAGMWT